MALTCEAPYSQTPSVCLTSQRRCALIVLTTRPNECVPRQVQDPGRALGSVFAEATNALRRCFWDPSPAVVVPCTTHACGYQRGESVSALLTTWRMSTCRDLQRATTNISYAPRLAPSGADVQWTTTNDVSHSRVSRIRPKIPRRWAPRVGTVGAWGAWVGQKAESPRRVRAASGAPLRGQN